MVEDVVYQSSIFVGVWRLGCYNKIPPNNLIWVWLASLNRNICMQASTLLTQQVTSYTKGRELNDRPIKPTGDLVMTVIASLVSWLYAQLGHCFVQTRQRKSHGWNHEFLQNGKTVLKQTEVHNHLSPLLLSWIWKYIFESHNDTVRSGRSCSLYLRVSWEIAHVNNVGQCLHCYGKGLYQLSARANLEVPKGSEVNSLLGL